MEYPNIEPLIERYFEGTTTLEEEQALRRFFVQQDLPAELEVYRNWFTYQDDQSTIEYTGAMPQTAPTPVRQLPLRRWLSLAAAILVLLVGSLWLWPTAKTPASTQTASIDWSKYEPATVEEGYQITAKALKTVATNFKHGAETTNQSLKEVSHLTRYGQ